MTRDGRVSGEGKGKEERRDGWMGMERNRGSLGESQAQTDKDKQCWWTGRFGVLQGGGGRGRTSRTGQRRREGFGGRSQRPPGRGELALRGERHSRTGMRYALLLL